MDGADPPSLPRAALAVGSSPPPAKRLPIALRSSPTEKCGPLAAMTTARTELSAETAAMARGKSRQRSMPIALRASGRSSQTVATCSSCSSVKTGESKVVLSAMERRLSGPDGTTEGSIRLNRPHFPPPPSSHHGRTPRRVHPAHLQRGGFRRPRRSTLAPAAPGVGVCRVLVHPTSLGERRGLALHAHRQTGPGRVRTAHPARGARWDQRHRSPSRRPVDRLHHLARVARRPRPRAQRRAGSFRASPRNERPARAACLRGRQHRVPRAGVAGFGPRRR